MVNHKTWLKFMLFFVAALILVGLLGLKGHTIPLTITIGLGLMAIFVLSYLAIVMVRLFGMFWESLEVE